MKKPHNPSIIYYGALILTGFLFAAFMLQVNQLFPIKVHLASLLSPTGAQVTVSGARIKHWVVGIFVLIFGVAVYFKNRTTPWLRDIGVSISSSGQFLILDEYKDVWRFITERQYP